MLNLPTSFESLVRVWFSLPPPFYPANCRLSKECWYFTKEGQKFTRKDITGESMKLQAKKDVDPDLRAALVDSEDGLMKAGALPKVSSASAAGSKALLDSIEKVGWWGILSFKHTIISKFKVM